MKFISTICVILIGYLGFAQNQSEDSLLKSRFRPGLFWFNTGWKPATKLWKGNKYDRLIIDVTYNQLFSGKALTQQVGRSIGCNVNTMWDVPMSPGNTTSFGIGLAYKFQKTSPRGLFVANSDFTTFQGPDSLYASIRKNTFSNHILALPIEFRFRSPGWKHFKFHVGGSIGYRLGTIQKAWFEGVKQPLRLKKFSDVQGLVYGVHMRMGIRNWALFADYTFASQFKSDKSSKINSLAVGISLSLF